MSDRPISSHKPSPPGSPSFSYSCATSSLGNCSNNCAEIDNLSDNLDWDEISLSSSLSYFDFESDTDDECCGSLLFASRDRTILTSICNAYVLKNSAEFKRLLDVFKSDHTQCDISNRDLILSFLGSTLRLIHGYRRNSAKEGRKNYSLPILIGKQKRSILAKLQAARGIIIPKKRGRKPRLPNSEGYYSDHSQH